MMETNHIRPLWLTEWPVGPSTVLQLRVKKKKDFCYDTHVLCTHMLEKEMATHSSIVAWRTPWTERRAWWAIVHGVTKSRTQQSDLARHTSAKKASGRHTSSAHFSKWLCRRGQAAGQQTQLCRTTDGFSDATRAKLSYENARLCEWKGDACQDTGGLVSALKAK